MYANNLKNQPYLVKNYELLSQNLVIYFSMNIFTICKQLNCYDLHVTVSILIYILICTEM